MGYKRDKDFSKVSKLDVRLPGDSLDEKEIKQLPHLLGTSPECDVSRWSRAASSFLWVCSETCSHGHVSSAALASADRAAACFCGSMEGSVSLLFLTEGLCISVKKIHNIKIS